MANNLKKIALFSTLAGIAAAGTYYYLQKKESAKNQADSIDEFDDFDDDFDFDDEEIEAKPKRAYVSLNLEDAKEIVSENVIKALDKTKELISDFNVPEKLDKAKEFVGELASAKENKAEAPEYTTVYESSEEKTEEAADEEIEKDFDEEDAADSEDFEFTEDNN